MYEFANTSQPNGLLPGTHGFTTVSMTKGLPDTLRLRLEALSGYVHRVTTDEDGTYLSGNPFAWTHLVLENGEHAVGCVQPAPFDYTGRTNRLARYLCFDAADVPSFANMAELLLSDEVLAEVSKPWTGEPSWKTPWSSNRFFDERRETIERRNNLQPIHWMDWFGGDEGLRAAATLATVLQERVCGNGDSIVFRADPADPEATFRMLGFFSDLIALLPESIRSRATFCTYPAAIPGWMTCHLKGDFDSKTPGFSSLWVDTESRQIHGMERVVPDPEILALAERGTTRKPEPPPPPEIRVSRRPQNNPPTSVTRGAVPPTYNPIPIRTIRPPRDALSWSLTILCCLIGVLIALLFYTIFKIVTDRKQQESVSNGTVLRVALGEDSSKTNMVQSDLASHPKESIHKTNGRQSNGTGSENGKRLVKSPHKSTNGMDRNKGDDQTENELAASNLVKPDETRTDASERSSNELPTPHPPELLSAEKLIQYNNLTDFDKQTAVIRKSQKDWFWWTYQHPDDLTVTSSPVNVTPTGGGLHKPNDSGLPILLFNRKEKTIFWYCEKNDPDHFGKDPTLKKLWETLGSKKQDDGGV